MKNLLTIIYYFILINSGNAQDYFSNTYQFGFGNDHLLNDLHVFNDTIYAATGDICFSTGFSCATISKYNLSGDLLDTLNAEDFRFGNESVFSFTNDSIFMSGQSIMHPRLTSQFLSTDHQLSSYDTTLLIPDNRYTYFNEGLLYHDDAYYSYGNGGIIENDSIIGYIIKWESDLKTVDSVFIFQQFDLENMVDDLQVNPEGNLVFLNRGQSSSNFGHVGAMVTISPDGELLDEFFYEYEGGVNVLPNFVLTDTGNYVWSDNADFFVRDRIICYDRSTKKEKWETILPFDDFSDIRGYDVYDISRAKNGDILISGLAQDAEKILDRYRTGFIARLDATSGEVLWMRIYLDWNILTAESEGYYDNAFLNQVIELENGDILAGGRIEEKGFPEDILFWLLKVDENGCLFPDDCGEENFTSSVVNIGNTNNQINVYPNPNSGQFTIYFNEAFSGQLNIINVAGNKVHERHIKQKRELDFTFQVNPGIYFVTLTTESGESINKKIVVQQ